LKERKNLKKKEKKTLCMKEKKTHFEHFNENKNLKKYSVTLMCALPLSKMRAVIMQHPRLCYHCIKPAFMPSLRIMRTVITQHQSEHRY
jgi:hypothetical protein